GSTATFTATNVAVGDTVEFSVAHVDAGADGVVGTADDVLVHDLSGTTAPWTVTDGGAGDLDGIANGVIVTSWDVNQDAAGQAFAVTATDETTGATAAASFTDGNPHQNDPPPPPDVGVLAAPTGTSPTGSTDPDGSSAYNNTHWMVL